MFDSDIGSDEKRDGTGHSIGRADNKQNCCSNSNDHFSINLFEPGHDKNDDSKEDIKKELGPAFADDLTEIVLGSLNAKFSAEESGLPKFSNVRAYLAQVYTDVSGIYDQMLIQAGATPCCGGCGSLAM